MARDRISHGDRARAEAALADPREAAQPVASADDPAFDSFCRAVRLAIRTPVALVSIVRAEADRQDFVGQCGLGAPWATRRHTPLSHSFCQHVQQEDAPLIVEDAPTHALVCDNLAIRDLGVRAYLGVPIHGRAAAPLGALAAIDTVARDWTPDDLTLLEALAACVSDHIRYRITALGI